MQHKQGDFLQSIQAKLNSQAGQLQSIKTELKQLTRSNDNTKDKIVLTNKMEFLQYIKKGIIHVGANTGQERNFYGDSLNVLWIETIPKTFQALCKNVRNFSRHKCLNYLISSDDNKEYVFNIANQTGRSSIYQFTNHHYKDPRFKQNKSVKMKARRLDSLIQEKIINMNLYDALVTDCQGADYDVIISLGKKIKEFKIVKTEVMIKEIYKSITLEPQITNYMNLMGFELVTNFSYGIGATQRDNIYWNRKFSLENNCS